MFCVIFKTRTVEWDDFAQLHNFYTIFLDIFLSSKSRFVLEDDLELEI